MACLSNTNIHLDSRPAGKYAHINLLSPKSQFLALSLYVMYIISNIWGFDMARILLQIEKGKQKQFDKHRNNEVKQ